MKVVNDCPITRRSIFMLACLTVTLLFPAGCNAQTQSTAPASLTTLASVPESPSPTPSPSPTIFSSPTPVAVILSPTPTDVPSPTPTPTPNLPYTDSIAKDKSNTIVGGDGHPITLRNYTDAKNPTYQQLLTFLKSDRTDEIPFQTNKFMTADYAETLHNNAEKSGIRCAFVRISLKTNTGNYYRDLNAFETSDRGIVYIDCTGKTANQEGPQNLDTKVDVEVGYEYKRVFLVNPQNWQSIFGSSGTVTQINTVQW